MIQEQVLRFKVSMHDVQLVKVLDSCDYLMEKFKSLRLFDSLIFNNVIEQFTSIRILHDQVKLFGRLYDFIKLDYVWVSDHL